MAKLKLSKGGLAHERSQLKLFQKMLPTLDLKRSQLAIELAKAREEQTAAEAAVGELDAKIGAALPMLAVADIEVGGLVKMTGFELGRENVVGVYLPRLERIQCEVTPYSMLAKPAWVDVLVARLKDAAEQRMRAKVAAERVRILEQAVRRMTQRVNLFDKILIPTAKRNIKRIQIFLGDLERDAVVRSKLAKSKHKLPEATPEEAPAA